MGAPAQASRHMSREARKEFFVENLGHYRQVFLACQLPSPPNSALQNRVAETRRGLIGVFQQIVVYSCRVLGKARNHMAPRVCLALLVCIFYYKSTVC
jgi:hypothetical protein